MQAFHSDDYINHLKVVRPSMIKANTKQANIQYNIGESDCPCFKGLWDFSQISAGASLDAAIKLNHGSADICVNWAGKDSNSSTSRRAPSREEDASKWLLLHQRYCPSHLGTSQIS